MSRDYTHGQFCCPYCGGLRLLELSFVETELTDFKWPKEGVMQDTPITNLSWDLKCDEAVSNLVDAKPYKCSICGYAWASAGDVAMANAIIPLYTKETACKSLSTLRTALGPFYKYYFPEEALEYIRQDLSRKLKKVRKAESFLYLSDILRYYHVYTNNCKLEELPPGMGEIKLSDGSILVTSITPQYCWDWYITQ